MKRIILLTALILGTSSIATAEVFTANFEVIYNPYMESRNYQAPVTDLSKTAVLQEYDVAERNFMDISNPSMQEWLYRVTTHESVIHKRLEQGDIFEANFNYIENPSRKWEL